MSYDDDVAALFERGEDYLDGSTSSSPDPLGEIKTLGKKYSRFYLPYEQSTDIVFLNEGPNDPKSPLVWEHKIKIGSEYNNFYTCEREFSRDTCRICQFFNEIEERSGLAPVRFYSIMNLSSWEDSEGEHHENERTILAIRSEDVRNTIRTQFEQRGNLKFEKFNVSRSSSQTSPSTGSTFIHKESLSREDVVNLGGSEESADPLDLTDHIAPANDEQIEQLINHLRDSFNVTTPASPQTNEEEEEEFAVQEVDMG